jgi:hypothetical protein
VVILLFAYEGCVTVRKGPFSGVVEGDTRRGVRMPAGVCKSGVSHGLVGVEDRGSQEDVTLKTIEAAGANGEILCAIILSVRMIWGLKGDMGNKKSDARDDMQRYRETSAADARTYEDTNCHAVFYLECRVCPYLGLVPVLFAWHLSSLSTISVAAPYSISPIFC